MLLSVLLEAIHWLINLISILIVIRAFLSWLPLGEGNVITNFIITMTEPVLAPVRNLYFKFKFSRELPVDFSPVIAILLLSVVSEIINRIAWLV